VFVDDAGMFSARPFQKEYTADRIYTLKRELQDSFDVRARGRFTQPKVVFKTISDGKIVEVAYVGNDLRGDGKSARIVRTDNEKAVRGHAGYGKTLVISGDSVKVLGATKALAEAKAKLAKVLETEATVITLRDTRYGGSPESKREVITKNAELVVEAKKKKEGVSA